jgi:hypothetical protein
MSKTDLPEWERVLSSASRLQQILPDAVLVGGTESALYASHRLSTDADHVLADLRSRLDTVLADLESVAGWTTARVARPVLILGSLDGIETGVRQLIRAAPLETRIVQVGGGALTIPTEAEILRIKAALILKRNATRDYLDFVALADHMGAMPTLTALDLMDTLYPQPNGESAFQQLQIQLSNPMPYDLDEAGLAEYKNLTQRWHHWSNVTSECIRLSKLILDKIITPETP